MARSMSRGYPAHGAATPPAVTHGGRDDNEEDERRDGEDHETQPDRLDALPSAPLPTLDIGAFSYSKPGQRTPIPTCGHHWGSSGLWAAAATGRSGVPPKAGRAVVAYLFRVAGS